MNDALLEQSSRDRHETAARIQKLEEEVQRERMHLADIDVFDTLLSAYRADPRVADDPARDAAPDPADLVLLRNVVGHEPRSA